jgi:uncharacterized protein with PIN domain
MLKHNFEQMAILFSSCGRQYDVTLFQFGRTIDCACGERVGFETRICLPHNIEITFFADVMVGRLTRWLRAIGIDTAWEDAIPDGELVRRSVVENRYILTLDRRLPEERRVGNVLLLKSRNPFEQFRETVVHFNLRRPKEFFTRCLVCNNLLRQAKRRRNFRSASASDGSRKSTDFSILLKLRQSLLARPCTQYECAELSKMFSIVKQTEARNFAIARRLVPQDDSDNLN